MDTIDVSRYEYKYLLTPDQVPGIRRFLLRYCNADTNAQGVEWYGIRSLYLDTPDNALFRASAEKAVERLKLRVRGYTTGDGPVKLEIKRRVGDVVGKQSLIAAPSLWDSIGRHGISCLPESPFLRYVEQMRATPKVLVSYERHALYSTIDDYVRVTFDRRIQCQPVPQWRLFGNPRLWLPLDDPATAREDDSTYVLELKFKVAPPGWLRDLVRTFSLVRRGFSKYARAVRRVRADRDPAWDLRTPSFVPAQVWRVA